jgi:hypothetical protein
MAGSFKIDYLENVLDSYKNQFKTTFDFYERVQFKAVMPRDKF